jgi:hypothetical protein
MRKKSFIRRPCAACITHRLKVIIGKEIHEVVTQEVVAAVNSDFDPAEDATATLTTHLNQSKYLQF